MASLRTLLSFVLCAAAFGQQPSLTGRVFDSTEAVLPGVTVEAASADGVVRNTVTGADGSYALALPPGTYDLTFRLLNFATSVRRGVVVPPGGPSRADATLYLSASADVVVMAKQTFRDRAGLDGPVGDLPGVAGAASAGVVTAGQIGRRPFRRAGEVLETVPGVVISQHSGEGKANQYYLRGFNLDHGTDIAVSVAGVPVNMPTHGHGHGYADANFLIPELISGVQYKKGPYYADEGDFSSAGAVNVSYVSLLDRPLAHVQGGSHGFGRVLFAVSPRVGDGYVLFAVEAGKNDGPWVRPDDFRKLNGVLRYTRGDQRGGFSVTAMGYDAQWNATDQIPVRAVGESVSRFGLIDPSSGGATSRYSLASEWQRSAPAASTQAGAYAIRYRLSLFSNFTYFLDDPVHGDQFEQADDRLVAGARASRRWLRGRMESVAGVQVRHDHIRTVGLYKTRQRVRLSTTREDSVAQTSGGVYAQTSILWRPALRTIAGARADLYRFEVRDSGRTQAALLSPKLSVIIGPWRSTELYVSAGSGFHSNDARAGRAPLVRTRGGELGGRTTPVPRLHLTAALWGLDMASELLFAGDTGTTEATRPSRRVGVEVSTTCNVREWLAVDADYAFSRARFRGHDPAGDRIPGAVEGVASLGLSLIDFRGLSGELRYRYFGPRPLIEDGRVRSRASSLVNARMAYRLTPRVRLDVDAFNVLDAEVSDVDYFYTSRLPGESPEGVDDVHFHPVEPRSFRVGLATSF